MLNTRKYKAGKGKNKSSHAKPKGVLKRKGPRYDKSNTESLKVIDKHDNSGNIEDPQQITLSFNFEKNQNTLPDVSDGRLINSTLNGEDNENSVQCDVAITNESMNEIDEIEQLKDDQLPCLKNNKGIQSHRTDYNIRLDRKHIRKSYQDVKKVTNQTIERINNESTNTSANGDEIKIDIGKLSSERESSKYDQDNNVISNDANAMKGSNRIKADSQANGGNDRRAFNIKNVIIGCNYRTDVDSGGKVCNEKKTAMNRRHRQHTRRQTHPLTQRDNQSKSTGANHNNNNNITNHGKTTTVFKSFSYLNLPRLDLADIHEAVNNAIKHNKIFLCAGKYPTLRQSLRSRGWVEKDYKTRTPVTIANMPLCISEEDESQSLDQQHDCDETSINKEEDADADKKNSKIDKCLIIRSKHSSPAPDSILDRQCRLMAKAVQNYQPSLIWTYKRDDIDFKLLAKNQLVNHYEKIIPLATKVGLCESMKNLKWFQEVDPDTIFPRCFQLYFEEEKQAFIDDYRLTAAVNILKWIANAEANAEANKLATELLPDVIVDFALTACEEFINYFHHTDIDVTEDDYSKLNKNQWSLILQTSYQLIRNELKIRNRSIYRERVTTMLAKIKVLRPQFDVDGARNVWILKPAAKSRGRGIVCFDRLNDILEFNSQCKEQKLVVQKYIERPMLIYNTKFDIRQWFLVTDWNPLVVWIYKDSYLRFCTQQFTLCNLDERIHLSNNAIQKKYTNGERSEHLPDENMWTSEKFQEYLSEQGYEDIWENVIYDGMKQILIWALQSNQDIVDSRKHSFELYGADFMLGEDFRPWLIEINSTPDLAATTSVTAELCASVIEDTIKVIVDRKENKYCDTGGFELMLKQQPLEIPQYIGLNLTVQGKMIHSKSGKSTPKHDNKLEYLMQGKSGEDSQWTQYPDFRNISTPYSNSANRKNLKKLLTMASVRMHSSAHPPIAKNSTRLSNPTSPTPRKNANDSVKVLAGKAVPICHNIKKVQFSSVLERLLNSKIDPVKAR